MHIIIIISAVSLFCMIAIFINFVINLFLFKDISNYSNSIHLKNEDPLVSILVPARNEEDNILACLESLILQDHKNIEILVLDDGSTDHTNRIVSDLLKKDKRIRLVNGKLLEDGWVGKNFALYQLEKHAKGKYFFSTDADTIHKPNSVSSSMGCLLENRLDALSAYPDQVMKTFWERLIISFINFGLHVIFPIAAMKKFKKSTLSVALGALMLYKADVYKAVGGHTTIRNRCLEDILMSQLLRDHGFKFSIFDGKDIFSCRMYQRFSEAERGFRRFIYSFFKKSYFLSFLFSLLVFFIFLFPFIQLIFYLPFSFDDPLFVLLFSITGIHILLLLSMRIYVAIKYRWGILDVIIYPVAIISLLVMSLRLIADKKKKLEIDWKGRKYCLRGN